MEEGSSTASAWPRAAASVAVFRGRDVLLAQRAKGVAAGLWSLPGGHVEPGETARAAALREIMEETAISAKIVGVVDIHDVIHREVDGRVRVHYQIAVFAGVWVAGEPLAGDDCRRAKFVAPEEIGTYDLTERTATIIEAARKIIEAAGR